MVIRIGVLLGGESPEHEVSLQSARNVLKALDRTRYEVVLIGIDRDGRWHLSDEAAFLSVANDPRTTRLPAGGATLGITPGREARFTRLDTGEALPPLDVIFPVLHGPNGEDGTVQGLLRLAHIPVVGPGLLGSAVGMDKDFTKRLLRDGDIPVAPFLVASNPGTASSWDEVTQVLGPDVFVKPANMGSSVGVARARSESEYVSALDAAFEYDTKIIVEATIPGREIEVSVLGNDAPTASLPGEIVPLADFYSYEAKYLDIEGAILKAPAELDEAPSGGGKRARRQGVPGVGAFRNGPGRHVPHDGEARGFSGGVVGRQRSEYHPRVHSY